MGCACGRAAAGSYWLTAPMVDLAWGARPVGSLGLFAVHNQGSDRSGYPGGLDLGTAADGMARGIRAPIWGLWRWSADAQTWFSCTIPRNSNARSLGLVDWGRRTHVWSIVWRRHAAPRDAVARAALEPGLGTCAGTGAHGLYDPGTPWEASRAAPM
jgi:hypothetical protein